MTSRQQRRSLEEAIVDTVREPLIVLDDARASWLPAGPSIKHSWSRRQKPRAVRFTNWATANWHCPPTRPGPRPWHMSLADLLYFTQL